MKTFKGLLAAALIFALPLTALAQDDETVTARRVRGTDIVKYTVDWVASATATKTDVVIKNINKYLLMVVTNPDGVTPPADNYSITMTTADGLNVMGLESGANPLADVDTSNTEDWIPKLAGLTYGARFIDGDLTIAFTELATADCEGTITLYTLQP